jgi:glutamine synthetase adenylyltransferase
MSASTSAALQAAYVFLRQVEHRIQYLDDQQTHVLPAHEDLLWIAQSLGFEEGLVLFNKRQVKIIDQSRSVWKARQLWFSDCGL